MTDWKRRDIDIKKGKNKKLCLKQYESIRKDLNVNEHERRPNITLTQIKVNEQHFYCCSF